MDHEYWEEKLHGFIDKELEPADHLAVEQHVADCADCQGNLAYFQSMKKRLRMHADTVEIPAIVEDRLVKMVSKPSGRYRRLLTPAVAVALAAALVMAVLLPRQGDGYDFRDDALSGKIVCHDCHVAERSGLKPGELCEGGHRLGLLCDDGSVWRIASDQLGAKYISDVSMIHDRVRVTGAFLDGPQLVRIQNVEPLSSRHAALY